MEVIVIILTAISILALIFVIGCLVDDRSK